MPATSKKPKVTRQLPHSSLELLPANLSLHRGQSFLEPSHAIDDCAELMIDTIHKSSSAQINAPKEQGTRQRLPQADRHT